MNKTILRLRCYTESFNTDIIKVNKINNTFTIVYEKYQIVSFASSIIKNIVVLSFIFWPYFDYFNDLDFP